MHHATGSGLSLGLSMSLAHGKAIITFVFMKGYIVLNLNGWEEAWEPGRRSL